MKKLYYCFLLLFLLVNSNVQARDVLDSYWPYVVMGQCSDQDSGWWSSDEAKRIAENVLLYQKDCGGWPKNTRMQSILTQEQKDELMTSKQHNQGSTIDNGAVKLELTYLSKVYRAIDDEALKAKIKAGFQKGIQYLLDAQYDNGGWPQFYPLMGGYYDQITYNDDAMVNTMQILRHVYHKDGEFSIDVPDSTIAAAKMAFGKGIECILKTQYVQNGKLTIWCAQHNFQTLEPAKARAYELPSLSGSESAGIVELLMSLDNPNNEIKEAVRSAVSWFKENKISGIRLERCVNDEGKRDLRVVEDADAPELWARFYTLEDNTPFFCGRDGIKKYSISEIEYERRTGYSWYSNSGQTVLSEYENWLSKWGSTN